MLCAGKVVIDAFRLTDPRMQALGQEPRQTTSNLGHLQKPSIQVKCTRLCRIQFISPPQALIHGLGRHYYSLPINYRKNELEQKVCHIEMVVFFTSRCLVSSDVIKPPQEDVDEWSSVERLQRTQLKQ